MRTVVLDAELRAGLNGLSERVEVRDADGAPVGTFLPLHEQKAVVRNPSIPYTDEEMEQFERSGGASSLQDIWRRLGHS